MKIARVRKKSVCAMEPVACRASNLIENARSCKSHLWELSLCQEGLLVRGLVTVVNMVIMLLDFKVGFARLTVSFQRIVYLLYEIMIKFPGHWSGSEPACKQNIYCLAPPTIEHARHSALPEQATFDLDSTVQYHCHTGYATAGFPRAKCLAIDGQASW